MFSTGNVISESYTSCEVFTMYTSFHKLLLHTDGLSLNRGTADLKLDDISGGFLMVTESYLPGPGPFTCMNCDAVPRGDRNTMVWDRKKYIYI